MGGVATVVNHPAPLEFEPLRQRRRALGQDALDEIWADVYHTNSSPHVRHGQIAHQLDELLGPVARDAELVPLITSSSWVTRSTTACQMARCSLPSATTSTCQRPRSRSRSSHPTTRPGTRSTSTPRTVTRELVIADSQKREIDWLGLREDPTYQPIERSMLLALGAAELAERISCPH